MGVLQKLWFIRENPIEMDDDWGYPHVWTPPIFAILFILTYHVPGAQKMAK